MASESNTGELEKSTRRVHDPMHTPAVGETRFGFTHKNGSLDSTWFSVEVVGPSRHLPLVHVKNENGVSNRYRVTVCLFTRTVVDFPLLLEK